MHLYAFSPYLSFSSQISQAKNDPIMQEKPYAKLFSV
jgi:hypothetical protein